MTIRKRLARSHIVMLAVPILTAALVLAAGAAVGLVLLQRVYLPRLGLSLQELHRTGEQIEGLLSGLKGYAVLFAAGAAALVLGAVALTDVYLTRSLLRHISGPLAALSAGVDRIRDGDLETPIAYVEDDEFRPACDAVDEMAARLRESLEQQQRQQQRKQELLAGMSHDLKSPLTSIRAYTEALLEGVARDEDTRRRYLQTIYAKEADIEAMTNRLVVFARTDEYPVQARPLPLHRTLRELTDQWDAEGLDISVEEFPEMTVLADRELLGRIVANLLGNSRKYGGRDTVHVAVEARRAGDMAEIAFRDDGPGVPPEQLPRLFDVFYRGDAARTAPEGGSGIGLAVVQRAAQQMGGDVRAENRGGLCVTVRLPLAKEE